MKIGFYATIAATSLAITMGIPTPASSIAAAADCNPAVAAASAPAQDGSRKSPYDIKKGVNLPNYGGTAYLKLKAVYKGSSAVKKAKALTKKNNRSYLNYQLGQKGKRQVVILKVYIEAVEGYEDNTLYGDSVLGLYSGLYNKKATNELKNVSRLYLDKGKASDVNLYNGGHDTVYIGLMLPKNVKSFCVSENVWSEDLGDRDCWMRYNI